MASTRTRPSLLLVIGYFLTSASTSLFAQPVGTHRYSLQWMITQAEVIVKGEVESVKPIDAHRKYPNFYAVTIRVKDHFTKTTGDRMRIATAAPDTFLSLKKEDRAAVFFLTRTHNESDRQTHPRFYLPFRCEWMCKNLIHASGKVVVASFDQKGHSNRSATDPGQDP